MTSEAIQVVKDDEVAPAVHRIIREAKDFVVLVSPFNAFWTHLKNDIQVAIQRKVRITLIYQTESYTRGDGTEWLIAQGGKAYRLPNLHAKIYLNESSAMLSSMNLTQGSSKNSMDIGMLVHGTDAAYKELLAYARRLASLATPIESGAKENANGGMQRTEEPVPARNDSVLHSILRNRDEIPKTALKTARAWITRGHCIRCQKIIPYDAGNPLCDNDYAIWGQFNNRDYGEKFCHKCGTPSQTTYARPLCASCSAKPRSRFPSIKGVAGGASKQSEDAAPAAERKP